MLNSVQVRCAEEGDEAGVKQAVQAGASVDWVDSSGWSALHYAAASGNSGMVKLLLSCSAQLEVRSTAAGEEGMCAQASVHLFFSCMDN